MRNTSQNNVFRDVIYRLRGEYSYSARGFEPAARRDRPGVTVRELWGGGGVGGPAGGDSDDGDGEKRVRDGRDRDREKRGQSKRARGPRGRLGSDRAERSRPYYTGDGPGHVAVRRVRAPVI